MNSVARVADAQKRRALISTISPVTGGIPTMTAYIVETLRSRGFEPVLAHYEPYSVAPKMSVPLLRILRDRVRASQRLAIGNCETHAIGAWLPELEFTHYWATDYWRRLADEAGAHIVVSGNALGAMPFYQTSRPFVAWLASGWAADREHRVKEFSVARGLLDRAVVRPVARPMERAILNRGYILSLSEYTRRTLDLLAKRPVVRDVLPMPIDTQFFSPKRESRIRGRIGFSGRFDDPRKNIGLLLEALAILRKRGREATALIIGGAPTPAMRAKISAYGIDDGIEFRPYGDREALRGYLRTLDVFVVPSYQEGLCIAALEAMACGLPVVSTRCGGPEEFVLDDETGYLVDFDATAMADALLSVLTNEQRLERLAAAARDLVLRNYSFERANGAFWKAFDSSFSDAMKLAA